MASTKSTNFNFVRVPGQGVVRFPADTPPEVMRSRIKNKFFPSGAETPRGFRETLRVGGISDIPKLAQTEGAISAGLKLLIGSDPATREAERTRIQGIPEVRALDAEIAEIETQEGPESPALIPLFEERERLVNAATPPEPRELSMQQIKETMGGIAQAVRADPGGTAAEIVNAAVADPLLLFVPIGAGIPGVAKTVKGAAATTAGVEAGVAAGADALIQQAESGTIDKSQLVASGTIGAAIGGALGGAAKGFAVGARKAANNKLIEDAETTPAVMPLDPELDTTPTDISTSVKMGSRQGQTLEGALDETYASLGLEPRRIAQSKVATFEEVQTGVRDSVAATQDLLARDPAVLEPRPSRLALDTPESRALERLRGPEDLASVEVRRTRALLDRPVDAPQDTPQAARLRNEAPTMQERRSKVDQTTLGRISRQAGGVDPRLLAGLGIAGATGLGLAAVDPEKRADVIYAGALAAMAAIAGPGVVRKLRARPRLIRDVRGRQASVAQAESIQTLDELDAQLRAIDLGARRVTNDLKERIPDAELRENIARHIDDPDNVPLASEAARNEADLVRNYMDEIWDQAADEGIIRSYIENYVPHIWKQREFTQQPEWARRHFEGKLSRSTPFAKQRKYTTISEGEAQGLELRTADIAEITGHYTRSVARAIAVDRAVKALKELEDEFGNKLVMAQKSAPKGYVEVRSPAMVGLVAHPEIAGPLRLLFGTANPSVFRGALAALNFSSKRMLVSTSFFHGKALVESLIWSMGFKGGTLPSTVGQAAVGAAVGGAVLGAPGAVIGGVLGATRGTGLRLRRPTIAKAKGVERFSLAAESRELAKQMTREMFDQGLIPRHAQMLARGNQDFVELAVRSGLGIGIVEDVGNQRFFDTLDVLANKFDELPIPNVARGFKNLNHFVDSIMWDRVLNGSKLMVFAHELRRAIEKNARKHQRSNGRVPIIPHEQMARDIATYVNDAFGNLDWRGLAEGVNNYHLRKLATKINSPDARTVTQLGLFAPDWTTANMRILGKAFSAFLGIPFTKAGTKAFRNKTTGGLYRMYLLRSSLWFGLGSAAIASLYGGEWPNPEDPLRIDLGDGRQMQFAKQYSEFFKWFLKPDQDSPVGLTPSINATHKSLVGKAAQLPKTFLEAVTRKEFVTVDTDRGTLVGPSAELSELPRLVGQKFTPIFAQQAARFAEGDLADSLERGTLSFLGLPVYGTRESDGVR